MTVGTQQEHAGDGGMLTVVAAADVAYAQPLAVMLRSVERHLDPSRRLRAFVLSHDIGEAERERVEASLERPGTIHWLSPRRAEAGMLPLWGRFPVSVYDSLAVADVLPPDVDRALWLDCDALVLEDISLLWDEALGEAHAGAVRDELIPTVGSGFGVRSHGELGMPGETPYFNAGVLFLSCDAWREERVADRALEFLENYGDEAFFLDQEALNCVLFGKWRELAGRWNYNASLDQHGIGPRLRAGRPVELPGVLHFAGGRKPWLALGDRAFRDLYFEVLDETEWRGWRPNGSAKATAIEVYSASILHRWLRPLEHRLLRLVRRFTLR